MLVAPKVSFHDPSDGGFCYLLDGMTRFWGILALTQAASYLLALRGNAGDVDHDI